MNEDIQSGEIEQSPAERRREKIRKNFNELLRRREAGELSEADYGPEGIYYLQEEGMPLTKKDLGNQAAVLTQKQLEQLGYLEIVLPNGEVSLIEPEDTGYEEEDLLIIFPDDLGDPE